MTPEIEKNIDTKNDPVAKRNKNWWKIGAITGLIVVFVATLTIGAYWKIHYNKAAVLERRQTIIKSKLVEMLSAKTIDQSFQYRDKQDKSKVATITLHSNFSNPRKPETRGTINISYLEQKIEKRQTAEFITLKATDGGDDIYLRITEGRELTNAPEGWYYADAFRTLKSVPGFKNFWYFSYDKLNQIQGYVVTGSLRDTPEKDKITQEIMNDKAYALNSCSQHNEEITCTGDLNPGGLRSVDTNVAISEALSSTNFGTGGSVPNPSPISFTVDTTKKGISRFELSKDADSNPLVVKYSNIDEPFSLDLPKDSQRLPATR